MKRNQTYAGPGLLSAQTPYGKHVMAHRKGSQWLHPWTIMPFWNPYITGGGAWCCWVNPGFVNGREPAIRMQAADGLSKKERAAIKDVTVSSYDIKSFFSSDPKKGFKDFLITDQKNPFLVLSGWTDGTVGSQVSKDDKAKVGMGIYPPYFAHHGAMQPTVQASAEQLFGLKPVVVSYTDQNAQEKLYGKRLLVRTDVILVAEHGGITSENVVDAATGIPSNFIKFTQRQDRYPYHLNTVPYWQREAYPTQEQILTEDATAPQSDSIKIATIWLLSPPGASWTDYSLDTGTDTLALGSFKPDQTWEPFVQHDCFWNLHYRASISQTQIASQNAYFFVPLAGGVGQAIINVILGVSNRVNQDMVNSLAHTELRGYFWTA